MSLDMQDPILPWAIVAGVACLGAFAYFFWLPIFRLWAADRRYERRLRNEVVANTEDFDTAPGVTLFGVPVFVVYHLQKNQILKVDGKLYVSPAVWATLERGRHEFEKGTK